MESFTCETGEHSWGGYPEAQDAGRCHPCAQKGQERHEYSGKGLVAKIDEKVRQERQRVAAERAAVKRASRRAPATPAASQSGSECPLCGFQFTKPQPRCSNRKACEKRQAQRPIPLVDLMAAIKPGPPPPHRRHFGSSWELELDSLADRLAANTAAKDDPAWRARVAKLPAQHYGETTADKTASVIKRAIELVEGRQAS